jgi:hypothetical protein
MRTASVTVLANSAQAATPAATITTDRTWTVGRAPDCDIVVDDGRVSRRHLIVESAGPAWVIRDVSANGSWVGGGRIDPSGVVIPDAGDVRLRLGDPAGPELVVAGYPAVSPVASVGAVAPVSGRRRRRRWPIAVIVALIVVLVVGDRVAAAAASTAAVGQVVQQTQGLGSKPTVSFGGIPFLTQVAFGKYSDIAVGIDDITPAGGPRIQHLSAHLKGAHIPFSKAVKNNIKTIPVDHVTGTVSIAYADLNGFLKNQPGQLVLAAGKDGAVQISGNVSEGSSPIAVTGSAKLQVSRSAARASTTFSAASAA